MNDREQTNMKKEVTSSLKEKINPVIISEK